MRPTYVLANFGLGWKTVRCVVLAFLPCLNLRRASLLSRTILLEDMTSLLGRRTFLMIGCCTGSERFEGFHALWVKSSSKLHKVTREDVIKH